MCEKTEPRRERGTAKKIEEREVQLFGEPQGQHHTHTLNIIAVPLSLSLAKKEASDLWREI